MGNEYFSVALVELEDGPKELRGPLPNAWLARMLVDTDVEPAGETDGDLDLVLTKNGSDVLVQGRLRTRVSLPCARTLDPAVYAISAEVFLLLAPASAGPHSAERSSKRRQRKAKKETPAKRGPKKQGGWEQDPEMTEQDAAQDTYSGDQVVLDSFLREFVLLELPMVPLREDLRDSPFEANPPLPDAHRASGAQHSTSPTGGTVPPGGAAECDKAVGSPLPGGHQPSETDDQPIDPRLSPLVALKAMLEKKE